MRTAEEIWDEAALKHSAQGLGAVRKHAIEQAQREIVEEAQKTIAAIEVPFDHHKQTGESCAFGNALDAAEFAVGNLLPNKEG